MHELCEHLFRKTTSVNFIRQLITIYIEVQHIVKEINI